MVALDVVVVVVVALLALLVAGLLRSNAELTRAMHQLGIDLGGDSPTGVTTPVTLSGAGAPTGPGRPTPARPDAADLVDLAGTTPAGEAISVAVTEVRHDTLIAFLTSGCQTCKVIWEAFRAGVDDVPGGARVVAVTRGADGESPGAVGQLAGTRVPVVMSTDTWQHYDVPYAPYFVYVSGAEGRVVGEGVASSWDQVKGLLATAVADRNAPPPVAGLDIDEQWAATGAAPMGGAATGAAPVAGAATTAGGRPGSSPARHDRIDQELSSAGIFPGDPRLHHRSLHEHAAADDER